MNARSDVCAQCGRNPATGLAFINDKRFCHGDYDTSPTCYEQASWAWPFAADLKCGAGACLCGGCVI